MIRPHGRLAQWESACFTRKRSLVQTQCRPPIAAPSSSGLGRSPLKAEIAGSNPAGATPTILLEDLHKGGVEWSDLAADDPAGLDVDLVEEVGEEASLRRWRGLVPGVDKVRRPRSRRLRRLRALELGDGLGLECAVVGEAGAIRRSSISPHSKRWPSRSIDSSILALLRRGFSRFGAAAKVTLISASSSIHSMRPRTKTRRWSSRTPRRLESRRGYLAGTPVPGKPGRAPGTREKRASLRSAGGWVVLDPEHGRICARRDLHHVLRRAGRTRNLKRVVAALNKDRTVRKARTVGH